MFCLGTDLIDYINQLIGMGYGIFVKFCLDFDIPCL